TRTPESGKPECRLGWPRTRTIPTFCHTSRTSTEASTRETPCPWTCGPPRRSVRRCPTSPPVPGSRDSALASSCRPPFLDGLPQIHAQVKCLLVRIDQGVTPVPRLHGHAVLLDPVQPPLLHVPQHQQPHVAVRWSRWLLFVGYLHTTTSFCQNSLNSSHVGTLGSGLRSTFPSAMS